MRSTERLAGIGVLEAAEGQQHDVRYMVEIYQERHGEPYDGRGSLSLIDPEGQLPLYDLMKQWGKLTLHMQAGQRFRRIPIYLKSTDGAFEFDGDPE